MSTSQLSQPQIELLKRMYDADKRDPSALHDFSELLGEDLATLSVGWLEETYEDLQALGFLHRASGQTFGGPFGRLSSRGRWFVESMEPASSRPDLRVETTARAADDQYFRFGGGTVIVRVPTDDEQPWLLTWLPDSQDDPAYPGFTISPDSVEFPTVNGVGGVLEWAARQPWSRRASGEDVEAAPPSEGVSLDVPSAAYAVFSEEVHAEFGFRVAFTSEPDGSVSWVVLAEEGLELASGVADTWDDARLAVIERLYPPSGEQ